MQSEDSWAFPREVERWGPSEPPEHCSHLLAFHIPLIFPAYPVFSVCWSVCQFVCLLPEWGWTCHSGVRQRNRWQMAGECNNCNPEGWTRPTVRSFYRHILSSFSDKWGLG